MSIKFDITVESYDVQPNGNIKISSLLKFLQKAAGDDVNRTSLDFFSLKEKNIAFVLTKMNLQIIKDIKIYDTVSIISHPRAVHGASFPRDFVIMVNNEIVALAHSVWVLLDLEKRTILRPSVLNDLGALPPSDEDIHEVIDVRRNVDINSLSRTDVLCVNYSHLDMNNHLNNTYYADFIFNIIDSDLHTSDAGLYLQINYKAEARMNDELVIHSSQDLCEFDFIAENNTNSKTCFTAYIKFNN